MTLKNTGIKTVELTSAAGRKIEAKQGSSLAAPADLAKAGQEMWNRQFKPAVKEPVKPAVIPEVK